MEIGGEIDKFQLGGPPNCGGIPNVSFAFESGFNQHNPPNEPCHRDTRGRCNATSDPNAPSIASFYLGLPSGASVDSIGSEGAPVYAAYFQYDRRVTYKMTLDPGLGYGLQRRLRERHNHLSRGLCLTCVNPLKNDSNCRATVQDSANNSAWTAAGIAVSSISQILGDVQSAGANGLPRDTRGELTAARRLGRTRGEGPASHIPNGACAGLGTAGPNQTTSRECCRFLGNLLSNRSR